MKSLEGRLSRLEKKAPKPPDIPTLEDLGIIDDLTDIDSLGGAESEQQTEKGRE